MGHGRRVEHETRGGGRLQGAVRRAPAGRCGTIQRSRDRRVAERERSAGGCGGLHADEGRDRARGLRMGRHRGAGGRRQHTARRSQSLGSRTLRHAEPSGRRVLIRHLLPGHAGDSPSERRRPARRLARSVRNRDRALAVRVQARHLHQRISSAHAPLQRLPDPQPRSQCSRSHGGATRPRRRADSCRRSHSH